MTDCPVNVKKYIFLTAVFSDGSFFMKQSDTPLLQGIAHFFTYVQN